MNYKYILFDIHQQVAVITLNRPDKLNAICFEMVEEINQAIALINTNTINALIIKGNNKAFSAGGDLKEMQHLDAPEATRRSTFIHEAFQKMYSLPVPVVAFIQGICFGGGLEIALHCDFRISSKNARFAFPEVKYGIIPGAGGTVQFPIQAGSANAAYYLTTGDEFDPSVAHAMQIVQKIVTEADLEDEVDRLVRLYNGVSNENIRALKQTWIKNRIQPLDDAYALEAELFASLLSKNGSDSIRKNFK